MQKDYLKYLISKSKNFAKGAEIFDIVLYGSFAKGKEKPEDIDIMLIFEKTSLKERTDIAHKFKVLISRKDKLDVKTINLKELFEKEFLAKQGILIEGYSLLYKEKFSERIGFKGSSLFTYSLKNFSHNKKTKFTYALIGRRKEKGILKQLNIIPLGKGVFEVPTENSLIFEEFLTKWETNYTKKNILISQTW